MRSTPVVSSTDHGRESPAVVRPLAFGPVGFFLRAWRLGYSTPAPIEPRDEVAELVREFNAAVALQAQIVERMERAASRVGIKAVAP